jgi:hypothetical protein
MLVAERPRVVVKSIAWSFHLSTTCATLQGEPTNLKRRVNFADAVRKSAEARTAERGRGMCAASYRRTAKTELT